MKKIINKFSILGLVLNIGLAATATFGQATPITKEEFAKEIDKAWKTTEAAFPRRETYSNLEES